MQVEAAAVRVGERIGLSLVEFGIVGTLLALSIALNLYAVKKLLQVQDKRIDDKEQDNQRIERLNAATTDVLTKVSSAVSSLERSDRDASVLLQSMKSTLDTVVLQAVMSRRSSSSANMPRVHDTKERE